MRTSGPRAAASPLLVPAAASGVFVGLTFLAVPPSGFLGARLGALNASLRERLLQRLHETRFYFALPFAAAGAYAAARGPVPASPPRADVSGVGSARLAMTGTFGRRSYRLIACKDPQVELSLLLPWEDREQSLRDHVLEVTAPFVGKHEIGEAQIREILDDAYLPSERPTGWEFMLSTTYVSLPAGAPRTSKLLLWPQGRAEQPSHWLLA